MRFPSTSFSVDLLRQQRPHIRLHLPWDIAVSQHTIYGVADQHAVCRDIAILLPARIWIGGSDRDQPVLLRNTQPLHLLDDLMAIAASAATSCALRELVQLRCAQIVILDRIPARLGARRAAPFCVATLNPRRERAKSSYLLLLNIPHESSR